MKVWKDIISGDEMVSDSYPHVFINEDAILEVQSRLISKNQNDNFGIASNDDDDGGNNEDTVSIIDIVDTFKLKEVEVTKGQFTAYVKVYLPKIKAKLTESGKADRIPAFQRGATTFVKHVLEKFDEIQFFVGDSYDMEGAYAYAYYKEQTDAGPTFFYFVDGLREEKF